MTAVAQPASAWLCATARVCNRRGIHVGPALAIRAVAGSFPGVMVQLAVVSSGGRLGRPGVARGDSIMQMVALGAVFGTVVEVRATGADADKVLAAVVRAISDGFGDVS